MDLGKQLHEEEVTGWQRGLYADIRETFRAPVVNWIFRTLVANDPPLARHLWGQVKPTFETKGFGRFSVRYRDRVLSVAEDRGKLPTVDPSTLGMSPSAFSTFRMEAAAFDVVGPRLAVLFELVHRAFDGRPIGDPKRLTLASTSPLQDELDRGRSLAPRLVSTDEAPDQASELLADVRSVNGFGDSLPTVYRWLLAHPAAFERLWPVVRPLLADDTVAEAFQSAATATVEEFVEGVPYPPALSPTALDEAGFDRERTAALGSLFERFRTGPVRLVLPSLHVYAATVSAEGARSWDADE